MRSVERRRSGRQPSRDVFAARQAAGMHQLAVNHDARRGHRAVAGDRGVIGDLLDRDLHAEFRGFDLDHRGRSHAALAAGTQDLDVFHDIPRQANSTLNRNPTARIPVATTPTNTAISLGLSTLRRMIISGNDSAVTDIMKASTVPIAAPLPISASTTGMMPAALEYIGTPSATTAGTDHHSPRPMMLA